MIGFDIPYIKMRVSMVSETPAPLQKWASSTIRGAFGNRMLAAFCTTGSYKCQYCTERCNAGVLYGTAQPDRSEESINPYIINCDSNAYDGRTLVYDFTLFSEGVDTVDDVLAVLNSGLELGPDRTVFRLSEITDAENGDVIFDGTNYFKPEIRHMKFEEQPAKKICIEFITPYKTKLSMNGFGFEQLVRASLRRVSTAIRNAGGCPDFDYSSLVSKSAEITTKYRALKEEHMTRYSNRSKSKMELSGFVGIMICEGDLSGFIPLLRAVETIHVGKLCVMGLGKIKVYILE